MNRVLFATAASAFAESWAYFGGSVDDIYTALGLAAHALELPGWAMMVGGFGLFGGALRAGRYTRFLFG